ncbi:MAG: type II secretion system minor pseudopilin GspK [Nitrospirae bacterium]|nr:type II secretion system minor pseudopilin GspK [Nitrospirota bacterium]MCL5422808.1 type II secretion system minor pseudopilin GspK [Nitrospirota bacterium]
MKRKAHKEVCLKADRVKHKTHHASRITHHASGEKGMALVLTLMILVLITAMVVEFSYGVYTSTSALHNWKEAQKLSFVSKSGVSLAVKTIADIPKTDLYRFPGRMVIPVENILEGFSGTLIVTVEDENAKFNLNSLRIPDSIKVLKRLLTNLGLDESIADRVADWIDADSEPRLRDSEEGAKNVFMDSVDELLLITGIDAQIYEALLPYVTVYGYGNTDDARININTAPVPVIMSLDARITKDRAEEVVNQRKLEPFASLGQLSRAGFDNTLITAISANATSGAPINFRIASVAEENGIKRVIEGVVKISGSGRVVYWREM